MDMLVHIDPGKYGPNVVYEKVKKVLYIEVIKSTYIMPQSYLLSYINLIKYLETDGLKVNPYKPYVDNNTIEGDPLLIVFHVDDVKEIHKDTKVV